MVRTVLGLTLLAALALAPVAAQVAGNPYFLTLATRAAIFALAAVSLQFIAGYGGLVSFGHAAFLGIGAYTLLILGSYGLDDAVLSLPAALLAAALFAAATGWVALRTRGVAFIMVTLAFGQMAFFVAGALATYGGDDGTALDRTPPLLGTAALDSPVPLHLAALASLLAALLLSHAVGRSRFGRALQAARDAEDRVAALGFNVRRLRLGATILAGCCGALAGWLLAVQSGFVSPALLDWRLSGELLAMVILGGVPSPLGAALGAGGLVLAEEVLGQATEHWRLLLGPALVLLVLLARPRQAA